MTSLRLFFLVCFLCCDLCCFAQNVEEGKEPRDTLAVYKKIKKVAYKHKATKLLYHSIFVDPAPPKYQKKPLPNQHHRKDPNTIYDGKIIRSIDISVLDPFGFSVNDTLWEADQNSLQKLGNKYHIRTRRRIIRNLLLFKPNERFDALKVSESERLIRSVGYVSDARIYIEAKSTTSDSVDLKVFVLDKWAIVVPVRVGLSNVRLTIRDKNMGGSGQRFEQYVNYKTNGQYQLASAYNVNNISDTYITANAAFTKTNDVIRSEISFDRPFYSGLTKWAGGAGISQTWGRYKYAATGESTERVVPLTYRNTDLWFGRSVNSPFGSSENRRLRNVIFALRYAQTNYDQRPSFDIDSNRVHTNSSLILGSVGFSKSTFYKDQYIFRFGANEDIPEGIIVQFLQGIFYREQFAARNYSGVDISIGTHLYGLGYFSTRATYGSFYNSKNNSSTLNLGFTYFTDLLRSKRWYFRQFVYWKYIYGLNKLPYERITLRPDEMYGFNNGSLIGTSKMLLNLETLMYTPYNFIGFHFAPLVLVGYGVLKNDQTHLFDHRIYQSYALGMLFRNENLLTSSFQLSFGFYPNLPDGNASHTKFNPVTSFSVKFRTFAIAKPVIVAYE